MSQKSCNVISDIPLIPFRTSPSSTTKTRRSPSPSSPLDEDRYIFNDHDFDSDTQMVDRRAPSRSGQPLLPKNDVERGRTAHDAPGASSEPPIFSRRSSMRSRSPDTVAKLAAKQKYTYAAFFLVLSLVSFTVQTETAVYIQHTLGWKKAYCMLLVNLLLFTTGAALTQNLLVILPMAPGLFSGLLNSSFCEFKKEKCHGKLFGGGTFT